MGSQLDAAQAWRDLAEALIDGGRSEQAVEALRRAADYAGVRASTVRAGLAVPVRDSHASQGPATRPAPTLRFVSRNSRHCARQSTTFWGRAYQ